MRRKRLGPFLMRIGLVGLGVATVWWIIFYTCVYEALGINDLPPAQCLLSNTGTCGLTSGIANVAGYLAYDPILFWLGGIACIIGYVMSNSGSRLSRDFPRVLRLGVFFCSTNSLGRAYLSESFSA
jgi:hypothetical protein